MVAPPVGDSNGGTTAPKRKRNPNRKRRRRHQAAAQVLCQEDVVERERLFAMPMADFAKEAKDEQLMQDTEYEPKDSDDTNDGFQRIPCGAHEP